MVFSSITFLIYFLPAFLLLYHIADKRFKNIIILLASIIFYSWGAPKFIFVILGTTFLDFHLVQMMDKTKSELQRKLFLLASLSINVGLLFYFKYCNFFVDNINILLESLSISPMNWTKLLLPIGISFYTFETITYVVDVYRRIHKPLNKFWDYQLYIILFPKLIAGPIIRYHDLADQITDREQNETVEKIFQGFYRFSLGLSKKVLIANYFGQLADTGFTTDFSTLGTIDAWITILAYTFQIYFDFSGYSDMAIGLAKMIGFHFPENFNHPYTSSSITEFWRRWHISLGTWMRNYLYIPLGGNRVKTERRHYFNLWLVFLISGFWHGASWNFIIWGAFHGAFLVLEKGPLQKIHSFIGRIPSVFLTFFIVMIGWVFFRIESFPHAIEFIRLLFTIKASSITTFEAQLYFYLFIGSLFSFFILIPGGKRINEIFYSETSNRVQNYIKLISSIILLILSISFITASGFNPFIYFRF